MTDSANLVLEHLKRFQAGQDRIERKLDELVTRVGALETGFASMRQDIARTDAAIAGLSVRLDAMGTRIDRIERRLQLG